MNFQYWQSKDNLNKTNELSSKKNTKNWKIKYYLTKLPRVYSYNHILEGEFKYFELLVKTLKV
jgi:hypothetical protein